MIAGLHNLSRQINPAPGASCTAPAVRTVTMGSVGSRPDFVEEREGDLIKSRIKYGYDERYRLSSVEQTVAVPGQEEPVTVTYAYDDAGRVTAMTTGQAEETTQEIQAIRLDTGQQRLILLSEYGLTPTAWARLQSGPQGAREREVHYYLVPSTPGWTRPA